MEVHTERRVNDNECDRVGPLQDTLVTPDVRGQSQLQGENPGVEGGQVVPEKNKK